MNKVFQFLTRLEDLDFADDVVLSVHPHGDSWVKTENSSWVAKTVALNINATKSKIMRMEVTNKEQIKMWEVEIKKVDKL